MPDTQPQPLLDPQFLAKLEQLELASRKIFLGRLKGERRSLWRVLDFLEKLEPAGPSDLGKALRAFSLKSSGKGVVVLLGDLMDKGGYQDALRYLLARRMDIHVLQILAQEEIEPELIGDLKLIDSEDADEAEITVNAPLWKGCQENPAAYRGGL